MECTLETLTPLYIPRGARDGDTEFFSYDHDSPSPKPVIPSLSICGVVRSVYEALTNNCLSTADDEQLLYKRTNEPKKPGLGKQAGKRAIFSYIEQFLYIYMVRAE
jgi:CRISPR/Cas system CSM-associated protein Csm5 (group 7 of RAMP superfamily)